jgi:hypothetical protein
LLLPREFNELPLPMGRSFSYRTKAESWVWWSMSIISALQRLSLEYGELEASLGYIVCSRSPCLKKRKKKNLKWDKR